MGAEYKYICSLCGFFIITSGPWEFSRSGEERYPEKVEPGAAGIDGLSGSVYCPDCNRVYDMILVEFDHPAHTDFNVWSVWSDPGNSFLKQNNVKCKVCGSDGLLLEPDEDRVISCPNCGQGNLCSELKGIL